MGANLGATRAAVVIGVAAVPVGAGIQLPGRFLHPYAERRTLLLLPLAGLVIAGLAVGYAEATEHPSTDVLFSGQSALPHLIDHAPGYTIGALLLVLVLVCKGLAFGVSLGNFPGGPVFPAIFIGAAGGVAMSHLPGLPMVTGVAMGIGAMRAVAATATTETPAATLEASLPAPTDSSHRAVVILRLRGRIDLGTTVMEVLARYAHAIAAAGSELVIVSASERIQDRLRVTGVTDLIGPGKIYPGDERVGATPKCAYADALSSVQDQDAEGTGQQ